MGITVLEALKLGGLRSSRLIAGISGLDRQIEQVTVFEVPDISQWLTGKELILTSGYSIPKSEEAQVELIRELAEKNVSALVIKTRRFIGEVPQGMVDEANKLGLPLIELETQIPYTEIIRPIMTEIINRETDSRLTQFQMVQRKLTEVAVFGGELPEKLAALYGLLSQPVAVADKNLNLLGAFPVGELDFSSLKKECKQMPVTRSYFRSQGSLGYYIFPLVIEGDSEGFLIVGQREGTMDQNTLLSVQGVAPVFIADVLRQKALRYVAKNDRNIFIEDLLLDHINSEAVACQRARFIGVNCGEHYLIAVMETVENSPQYKKLRDELKANLEQDLTGPDCWLLAATQGIRLVFLASLNGGGEQELRQYTELLTRAIGKYWPYPFTIGISRIFANLTDSRKNFLEAVEALELGQQVWGVGSVTLFADMGVYRLLSSIKDDELAHYLPRGLLKLVQYDQSNKTDFVKTLECYLKNGGIGNRAAAELFIHYKTLQYRLERIAQITEINLSSGERRLDLHLGLKIMEILSKRERSQKDLSFLDKKSHLDSV